ncbi:MAG: GGDEF domain-containing protein [Deltaproteobacteria bacterium]|nr:GGDEF domain-containing protein [Deltaproteobacteria bacterium]
MKKRSEGRTVKEKVCLENLVILCPDGIIAIDRKGMIVVFNHAAEGLTGYSAQETVGKMTIGDLYPSTKEARRIKRIMYGEDYGGPGRLKDFEVEVTTKAGHKVPIRLSATLIWAKEKEVGSVGFFHDLTRQKQMEARLQELSITDGLTGLFNHRHFYAVLGDEMNRADRYRRPLCLICSDLDNFKHCNDRYGHLEGDRVLRFLSDILRSVLRRTDRGFRYGGDEFMVLLPETDLRKASVVAQRIRNEFNSQYPYRPSGQKHASISVTLSLGVAQAGRGEEIEAFVKRVDLAMFEAKKAGGDQIRKARRLIGKRVGQATRERKREHS